MKETHKVKWLKEPEKHDYAAAYSYLTLLYKSDACKKLTKELQSADMGQFKAKDIFRASGLPLLGISNYHVEQDYFKLTHGERMSPILLVRDRAHGRVVIADGYHRLCAVYAVNEDANIPCKVV